MKTPRLLGLVLGSVLSVSAFAAGYDVEYPWKVPAAPKARSAVEKGDVAKLKEFQETRTKEECQIASRQNFQSAKVLFGPETKLLTARQFAALEPMLQEIVETSEKIAAPYKDKYRRPRPYDSYPAIKPCIRKPGGAKSYPSSHALSGMVGGLVLGKLFPKKKQFYYDAGVQIGTNRMLGGVHYPSDVGVGQRLGEQLFEALQRNAEFKRDFAKAKAEL